MAPRFPRLIATLAVLVAGPAVARAQAAPTAREPGRHVVTRELIEESGILRLGEVVRLAPGWNATTVDDFTWRAGPRALVPGAEDAWTLLIDGRPIDVGALGISSLERLPIDLVAIDSIVFVASPAVAGGVFAPAGLVHVHTSRPASGMSARARLGVGSETGDPGPFAFLPGGRPNRDRYGNESAIEGAVARGRWYAAGSYTASVHLPTDPLILPRIRATSTLPPRIERIAPAVRLGIDSHGGGHRLIAGISRIDDWQRLELAGFEVPVRSTLSHLSAAGAVRVPGFDLGYHAGYERSHIASRPEAAAPPFEFARRRARGMLEARSRRTAEPRIGITFLRRIDEGGSARSPFTVTEVGTFGSATLRSAASIRHQIAVAISSGGGGAEGGVVLTNTLAAAAGDLSLRLDAGRSRAMTATGLLELVARGDPWLDEAGTGIGFPPPGAMMRSAGAELGWMSPAASATTISSSAFLRAFDGALIARRDLAWDPVFHAWRGPAQVLAVAGRLAGGQLGVRQRVSRSFGLAVDVHVVEAFGDSDFRRAAEPIPAIRSTLAATWRPVAGFGLHGEVEIDSERRWPDYGVAVPGHGKARVAQPGGATGSVSMWKTFFGGRLRAHLAARNLTGRRVILHPEGRASALSFLFLLGAAF